MAARMRLPNMATTHACQSRQVASHPSTDEVRFKAARMRLPNMATAHRLPRGKADGIYATAQSHTCEISHLPK